MLKEWEKSHYLRRELHGLMPERSAVFPEWFSTLVYFLLKLIVCIEVSLTNAWSLVLSYVRPGRATTQKPSGRKPSFPETIALILLEAKEPGKVEQQICNLVRQWALPTLFATGTDCNPLPAISLESSCANAGCGARIRSVQTINQNFGRISYSRA